MVSLMLGIILFFLTWFLGRNYGLQTIEWARERFPKLQPDIDKSLAFLERHSTLCSIGVGILLPCTSFALIFVYLIAAQGVSLARFLVFFLIGCVVLMALMILFSAGVALFAGGGAVIWNGLSLFVTPH